ALVKEHPHELALGANALGQAIGAAVGAPPGWQGDRLARRGLSGCRPRLWRLGKLALEHVPRDAGNLGRPVDVQVAQEVVCGDANRRQKLVERFALATQVGEESGALENL